MRIIDSTGFFVEGDRQVEFQKWYRDNLDRIRKAFPKGLSFDGCYVAIFGNALDRGDTFWNVAGDSYAAFDGLAAALGDPRSELTKVYAELSDFMDTRPGIGNSRTLEKALDDAAVWDVPVD